MSSHFRSSRFPFIHSDGSRRASSDVPQRSDQVAGPSSGRDDILRSVSQRAQQEMRAESSENKYGYIANDSTARYRRSTPEIEGRLAELIKNERKANDEASRKRYAIHEDISYNLIRTEDANRAFNTIDSNLRRIVENIGKERKQLHKELKANELAKEGIAEDAIRNMENIQDYIERNIQQLTTSEQARASGMVAWREPGQNGTASEDAEKKYQVPTKSLEEAGTLLKGQCEAILKEDRQNHATNTHDFLQATILRVTARYRTEKELHRAALGARNDVRRGGNVLQPEQREAIRGLEKASQGLLSLRYLSRVFFVDDETRTVPPRYAPALQPETAVLAPDYPSRR
jgi:hypothetical protein